MLEKLIVGWLVNSFCILHLLFIDKSRIPLKLLALPILAIPYLGTVFYLIIYTWEIPSPISKSYQRHLQGKMIFKDITDPGRLIEKYDYSDLDLTGEEYDYSEDIIAPDRHVREYEHSERHIQSDDIPARSGRSSLWIRVSMFVLGVALWLMGIQWLKIWLFHPLFLFGGAFCIFMAFAKWNKF